MPNPRDLTGALAGRPAPGANRPRPGKERERRKPEDDPGEEAVPAPEGPEDKPVAGAFSTEAHEKRRSAPDFFLATALLVLGAALLLQFGLMFWMDLAAFRE